MQFIRGDADLGAQAIFETVGKARGGIDHHRCRIHFVQKPPCPSVILGNDRFGMLGAVLLNVSHGLLYPVNNSDGEDRSQVLATPILLRIVDGIEQAMAHIQQYSSQHTESIVTENYTRARRLLNEVDSASVMVNASTRFADGFEYGLGAEIGISTDKLHARGPVGLEGLTSQKWIVLGDGEVRV